MTRRNFLLALPTLAASGSMTTKIVDEVFAPQLCPHGSQSCLPPARVIVGAEPYDPANNGRDAVAAIGLLAHNSSVHAGLPLSPVEEPKRRFRVAGPWRCSVHVESLVGPEPLVRRLVHSGEPGVKPVTYLMLDNGVLTWDGCQCCDLRVVLTSPRVSISAMTANYSDNQLLQCASIVGSRAIFFNANNNECLFDTATAHGPHWSPTGLSTSDEMDEAWDKQFPARYEYFALRRLQLGALAPIATV